MTFKKSFLLIICSAALSQTAFASADKIAITAAEQAQKTAASVGYEWRDTGKMIKQAKKLSAEGKSAEAIKLAKKAEEQGKDAYAQYQIEAKRYSNTH